MNFEFWSIIYCVKFRYILLGVRLSNQKLQKSAIVTEAQASGDKTAEAAELSNLKKIMELTQQQMGEWWEMIQERESLIRSILGATDDLIMTIDQAGRLVDCNDAVLKFFQISLAQVKDKSIFEWIKGTELHKDFTQLLETSTQAGSSMLNSRLRRELRNSEGVLVPVTILTSKVKARHGYLYAIFIHDLSEELKANETLEQTRSQMMTSAKMAALGEMAGGIAHEINTPLNIFLMSADLLRETIEEDQIDRQILLDTADTIEKTATRISKIILGLRAFSRDDRKDSLELVDLKTVVTETLSLCSEKMMAAGIQIVVEESVSSDHFVECRHVGLSQVILNLVNNAKDAIEGLSEKWVRIGCHETDEQLTLYVRDSGHGISESVLKKLMQPFFTTKAVGHGTGLGLSISKGIIESFQGKLVYNGQGPHTEFQIILPRMHLNQVERKVV